MSFRLNILPTVVAVAMLACADNLADPIAPPAVVEPESVAAVRIDRDSAFILLGTAEYLSVTLTDSKQRRVANRFVTWSSSNEAVARVARDGNCAPLAMAGCYRTSVYGMTGGTATITASVDGISTSVTVRVIASYAAASGVRVDYLLIERASQQYAPLVTVTETSMTRGIEVIVVRIRVAGMLGSVFCRGQVMVAAGRSEVMFYDDYGDYQLVISDSNPRTSDDAWATVYLRDAAGAVDTVEVVTKVQRGPEFPPPGERRTMNQWSCA